MEVILVLGKSSNTCSQLSLSKEGEGGSTFEGGGVAPKHGTEEGGAPILKEIIEIAP